MGAYLGNPLFLKPSLNTCFSIFFHLAFFCGKAQSFVPLQASAAKWNKDQCEKYVVCQALKKDVVGIASIWFQPHPVIDDIENQWNPYATESKE